MMKNLTKKADEISKQKQANFYIWKLSIILRIERTFRQLIMICFGIGITSSKKKYSILIRMPKMPSALSLVLAPQAFMQKA